MYMRRGKYYNILMVEEFLKFFDVIVIVGYSWFMTFDYMFIFLKIYWLIWKFMESFTSSSSSSPSSSLYTFVAPILSHSYLVESWFEKFGYGLDWYSIVILYLQLYFLLPKMLEFGEARFSCWHSLYFFCYLLFPMLNCLSN